MAVTTEGETSGSSVTGAGNNRSSKPSRRNRRAAAAAAAQVGAGSMTLIEHLTELRKRVVVAAVAVAFGAIVAFLLYNRILGFLVHPYCQVVRDIKAKTLTSGCGLIATSPLDPFAVRLKIATYGGLLLASPIVLYQLWRFITPGLNPKEKRYAIPFVLSSILLFLLGCAVAWFTFVPALKFLISIGGNSLVTAFTPEKYLNLITFMLIAFGAAFQFPVILVFLEIANVLKPKQLLGWWRPAIVVIFILAAVITPSQDPYSLFLMAIPMIIFYFAAIGIGKLLGK